MKHLTLIVPDGETVLDSIVATYMLFNRANQFQMGIGKEPVFKIELAGLSKEIKLYGGLFSIRPKSNLKEIAKTDLVIIPAFQPNINFSESLKNNKQIISWILDQYKNGAEIISLCTGAFLLAETGLLDGRKCSTHWALADKFKQMFPKVKLNTKKIITEENGVYTSGGAFSFLNFLLLIIEKYYDRQTAVTCSKLFEIDMDRSSQAPFEIFSGQKKHLDEEIKKAQLYLENNFNEKINIENLAADLAVGRRNFDRRFKKATGNTHIEYLQKVKIEAAKKNLESTRKTISEVMYEVGYSDLKSFRTTFKKITGLSPLEYRNKFNREPVSSKRMF